MGEEKKRVQLRNGLVQYNKGKKSRSADTKEECEGGGEDSGVCGILWFIIEGEMEEEENVSVRYAGRKDT